MLDATLIGKKIKSIRETQNMTQMEFCELINCTQAALSGYENGTKIPSIDTLYTIATKCKISLDWLCGLLNQNDNRFSINTQSDILIIVNKLLISKNSIVLESVRRTDICTNEIGYSEEYSYDDLALCFNYGPFKPYVEKLQQMHNLLINGTIDNELYELWLNKTIEDLNNQVISFD
ncbi:MAG: helix-turn-helix transcriptional regulator [Coprobacillus sp.]|nr:helix-turn-helix transcriptional regulator [Coprobacillus sp.]